MNYLHYLKKIVNGLRIINRQNLFGYSFQARGYSMQLFFSITSYYVASENSTSLNFKNKITILLAIITAGLFTSPAFLYTAIPVYLIFFSNKQVTNIF